jgi:AcrR family transcriptional regulator
MNDDAGRGRPRDEEIDARLLAITLEMLADHGYEALSIKTVAAAAATSRQALYRRYPSKAALATAAIASISEAHLRTPSDDPLADLVAELEAFRRGISRPHGLSLAATMLQDGTDPDLARLYRERIVSPRRRALRAIMRRATEAGLVDAGADVDVEVAVSTMTGSWYAYALAGKSPPRDWAKRTARLAWRGLGGSA